MKKPPIQNDLKADMLDNAPMIIAFLDMDHNIVWANKAYQEATGLSLQEMEGRKCHLVWELAEPCRNCPVKTALEEGESCKAEMTPGNQEQWPDTRGSWLVGATPIRNRNGNIIGAMEVACDITEYKQTEKALQESEERLRLLVENTDDIIIMQDLTGKYLYYNSPVAYGFKAEDLLGKTPHDFHPPEVAAQMMNRFNRTVSSGQVTNEETKLDWKGKTIWFLDQYSPVKDSTGKIIAVITISRNITNYKKAEEALRESEEQLNTLINAMPDFICFKDGDGRWLKVNDAGIRIFQLEGIDYLGKTDSELAELNSRLRGAFLTCKESDAMAWNEGSLFRGEEIISQPDGSIRVYDVAKVPVFHQDGGRKGIVVLGHDITDRRQAEEALQESEDKMRTILNSMPDVVLQLDTNLTILWANDTSLKMNPDAIGQLCYKALPGRDEICPGCPIVRSLKTGQIERGVVHLQSVAGIGESYWDDVGVPIKDAQGNIVSIVKIARNVTDIERAEEEKTRMEDQYRQAQKMESVGRLAGGVAHDFNNMLGVIIGYTEMSLHKVDPAHPVYTALQEIRKAADRSADLTRQLLAFARRQTVSPRLLDLNETVGGMLKMLHRLIGEDIDLAWTPGTDLWPVKVDPAQIDQILANMCVNSRDAIAGVGKMIIETENVVLDESFCLEHPGSVPGEYVLLAVGDDGCGMDKQTMDNIFEPFFTTKEVGQGTGLGLATVYGIVKQNNGFIYVTSEPGDGTTFRTYLPRYAGKIAQMQKDGPAEQVNRGHETILLVEDEQSILKMTTTMLEYQGYTVLNATTPGEAIRLAGEYSGGIHLLMTDVVMPEMNGRDLAKNLLSLYPEIKRLFMSGYTADVIAHRQVLDKGVNFIQKPFTMQDLAAKVRKVLDSE